MNGYEITHSIDIDLEKSWILLQKTAYNQLIDQIHYNWQFPPGTYNGNACLDDDFADSCRFWVFASIDTPELEKSALYKNDAIEASCHLAGIKLERTCQGMIDAFNNGDKSKTTLLFTYFNSLIHLMDIVLAAHPRFRLAEWLDYAAKMAGDNETLKKHYRSDARYLNTVWGPSTYPLYDYAARMWNGMLRDYYFNRWQIWYKGKMEDKPDSQISSEVHQFENNWVEDSDLSRAPIPKDVVKACRALPDLVNFADSINLSNWDWPNLNKKKK